MIAFQKSITDLPFPNRQQLTLSNEIKCPLDEDQELLLAIGCMGSASAMIVLGLQNCLQIKVKNLNMHRLQRFESHMFKT